MLTWQQRFLNLGQRERWTSDRLEESRQHYANVRIAEWQRLRIRTTFVDLLTMFRFYGEEYDRGARLVVSSSPPNLKDHENG